jgi:hypothetical protein
VAAGVKPGHDEGDVSDNPSPGLDLMVQATLSLKGRGDFGALALTRGAG